MEWKLPEAHSGPGRVLIVAGSDSGGGAGIQGDIKTVTMFGGYAATAITALTAQNTEGVKAIQDVPADFVRLQMEMVLDDIGADAIKTGMLNTAAIIEVVADVIQTKALAVPVVVDPVMVAKGGARLLAPEAETALIKRLLPLASIVTPNIPEAEALTGMEITRLAHMKVAAAKILEMGPAAVLLKGGHLEGDRLHDVLLGHNLYEVFDSERIPTTNTHGTGCTAASAIAAGLAEGRRLVDAVIAAREYVHRAIAEAPGFGNGHGPLNHMVEPEDVKTVALAQGFR
jgi:hydroxymethylpyrimidine/phosphomethylpyrimidine kinase